MQTSLFDAVIFDLDGTLVATDRFWPDAARTATLRFFESRGIEREAPRAPEWMTMVGRPLADGFADVFPDLAEDVRDDLMAACVEEEHRRLDRGHASMLPGVEAALDELRERGVRLGIASNCSSDYLDAMMNGLGLTEWIEEGRCLYLPGIENKADMVADLLVTFDTRSAVMVGDRPGDRDAAWANGIPHVHIPRGYGGASDDIPAEAVLEGMDQLIPKLDERAAVLRSIARAFPPHSSVGVTGMPRAGKTLFARDLRRLVPPGVLVIDEPEGAERCDRLIEIVADEEVLVRRAQGERAGTKPVEELLSVSLPAWRSRERKEPSVIVDMTNPLVPRMG